MSTPNTYPIDEIRAQFPILPRLVYGKPLIYLDNTATSQTPQCVVDCVDRMYTRHHANVHRGVHCMSQEATDLVEQARRDVARFINAPEPETVIFTRGTTEGINLVADTLCSTLNAGDEILLTVMEHHSNIVPWQLAAAKHNLVVKAVPMLADGSLDMEALDTMLTERTRVVSVCHVSNVLGTVNPIRTIADKAHAAGAVVCVDGAQAVAHYAVDVQALDVDFYCFSSHKMYGPTGVGIVYGRRSLLEALPPYQGGGEMIDHVSFQGTTFAPLPFKYEAGTPDYTVIPAMSHAIEFIDKYGLEAMEAHEQMLMQRAVDGLMAVAPQTRIFGTAPGKCPLISFVLGDAHPYDTGMLLDKLGIAVRTGHHCAQPLMQVLGVPGTVRASFAAYNTVQEVDAFIAAVERIAPMLS